jgi:hypothetical protein
MTQISHTGREESTNKNVYTLGKEDKTPERHLVTFGRLTGVLLLLASLGSVAFALLGWFLLGISENSGAAAFAAYQREPLTIFLTYDGAMMVGLLFIALAPLLYLNFARPRSPLLLVAATCEVLAGLMQALSASRWLTVLPFLVHSYVNPQASAATRAALEVAYQSISYFLGITLGEHFYFLFTGGWSLLLAISLLREPARRIWLGWLGVVAGSCWLLASIEQLDFSGAPLFLSFVLAGALTWLIWTILLALTLLADKRNVLKPDPQRENQGNAAV